MTVQVINFLYCENANLSTNGSTSSISISNLISAIDLQDTSSPFSFSIVYSLLIQDTDFSDLRLRIVIENPQSEELVNTKEIVVPSNPEIVKLSQPMNIMNITPVLDLRNVKFPISGIYMTKLYVNDNLTGTFPLHVNIKEADE